MKIAFYQVDAFADRPFSGNPAAVCLLEEWLPEPVMQAVANENNLSETAFLVGEGGGYGIRWFTPQCEVTLCGHATLAAAHILYTTRGCDLGEIRFTSRSGLLLVRRNDHGLELDFPAQPPAPCRLPEPARLAFGETVRECREAMDYLLLLENEEAVREAKPDLELLRRLDHRGVIITAPAAAHDFVCRFFAPNYGIAEDPVTGSAFTQLAPFWAEHFGRQEFRARQVSRRGGEVHCRLVGNRVLISGRAVTYFAGAIDLGGVVASGKVALPGKPGGVFFF